MDKFCKIFESEEHGQILVKKDANDDSAPEIRTYFRPEGLGVCSFALSAEDTDEGWEWADEALDCIQKEQAEASVAKVKRGLLEG